MRVLPLFPAHFSSVQHNLKLSDDLIRFKNESCHLSHLSMFPPHAANTFLVPDHVKLVL